MNWIEVRALFEKAPDDWSFYVDIFDRHGCENTLQTDSPPTLSSAVANVAGSDAVIEALSNELRSAGASSVETGTLVDENWEENWKRFFKPRRVGERFMVRPTWEAADPASGRLDIVLDPGLAFGTGDHPTTRMSLELLERADVAGKRVADVGCGSGILSIGACLLGAEHVAAVDIDPISVEVAKENAAANGVRFDAVVGSGISALGEGQDWDVVVSNIISATLIAIAGDVAAEIRPGGLWVMSGIIQQNWEDVLEAATRVGFVLVERLEEDDWVAATLRKSPS
jgi:ribosomal protein L11 methyltransferase